MDKIILTTHEELKQLIAESVQTALKGHDSSSQSDAIAHSGTKYLTVAEAARYLNLAKQTVYGFTSSRTIPFIKRAKRLLFTKSELDAWLDEGRKKSLAQIRTELAGPAKKSA